MQQRRKVGLDLEIYVRERGRKPVVLNLGSRDSLGVPNANLGGPKCKSGISTNFPQYK